MASGGSQLPARMTAQEIAEQREMLDEFERMNLRAQEQPFHPSDRLSEPPPAYNELPGSSQPRLAVPGALPQGRLDPTRSRSPSLKKVHSHSSLSSSSHSSSQSSDSSSDDDSDFDTSEKKRTMEPNLYTTASGASSDEPVDDEQIMRTALDFAHHTAPPPYERITQLAKPVAIPQLQHGLGMPFARVYAPALQNHGISMNEFLEYIDGFNVISTEQPPLQILDMVGGVVSLVPNHWAQLAGNALQFSAKIGTKVASKTLGDQYMRRANKEYFHPRRLHVEIVKIEALQKIAQIPGNAPAIAQLDATTIDMSVAERRTIAWQPWLSPLVTNVPPPTAQTNILKKLCEKQVQKQSKKAQKKTMKNRLKALEKAPMLPPAEENELINKIINSGDPKLAKEAAKIREERYKNSGRAREDRIIGKKARVEDKFQKTMKKARRTGDPQLEQRALARRDKGLAKVREMEAKAQRKDKKKKPEEREEKRRKKYEKRDKEARNLVRDNWMVIRAWDASEESK